MSGGNQPDGWTDKEVKMTEAVLFRYNGDGEARCVDCVLDVMDANPGMRQSNWLDDEFNETACDACDATVVK
jgi:hypothetical protein